MHDVRSKGSAAIVAPSSTCPIPPRIGAVKSVNLTTWRRASVPLTRWSTFPSKHRCVQRARHPFHLYDAAVESRANYVLDPSSELLPDHHNG